MTPFGMPVVPPVYKKYRSSSLRSMRGIGSWAASTSSYCCRELLVWGAVVDLDPELHARCPVAHFGDVVAERAVEQQRFGVGVVEQVDELVFEIPVVHVDGNAAHLEGGVHALGVLVAVVEIRRDLRVGPEARSGERGGEPGGAVVERLPVDAAVALDQRDLISQGVGERFERVGEVPGHGRSFAETN